MWVPWGWRLLDPANWAGGLRSSVDPLPSSKKVHGQRTARGLDNDNDVRFALRGDSKTQTRFPRKPRPGVYQGGRTEWQQQVGEGVP